MKKNNFLLYFLSILIDLTRDILYFPVWWFSRGLLRLLLILKNFLVDKQKSLGLLIWLKNIFRPMYGQYDFAGILISFFVRFFQIIVRSVILTFWFFCTLTVLLFWIILPFFIIYEIIFQIAL